MNSNKTGLCRCLCLLFVFLLKQQESIWRKSALYKHLRPWPTSSLLFLLLCLSDSIFPRIPLTRSGTALYKHLPLTFNFPHFLLSQDSPDQVWYCQAALLEGRHGASHASQEVQMLMMILKSKMSEMRFIDCMIGRWCDCDVSKCRNTLDWLAAELVVN